MIFCSLFSGSSGNAIFLSYKNTNILIDCGVSGKRVTEALVQQGIDPCSLSAICVTHEHNDHIQSVGVLSRKYDLPVYASCGTWEGMEESIGVIKPHNIKVFESGKKFALFDLVAEPFPIYHDANEPVAYNFYLGEKKVSLLTDLGHVDHTICQSVTGCDTIILEANHDMGMLKNGPYPYHLKYRIAGEKGHLSNDTAANLAVYLAKHGTLRFLLGHLSRDNNTAQIAFDTVAEFLSKNQIKAGKDIILNVAKRNGFSAAFA